MVSAVVHAVPDNGIQQNYQKTELSSLPRCLTNFQPSVSSASCRWHLTEQLRRMFMISKRDAGVVMCLGQRADLHVAQLMPLPLTISRSSKSRLILPFWCRLIQVVLDKIQEGHKTVVCACVFEFGC